VEDEIWECKDGRRIPVSEMSEDHVRSTLRMIIRTRRRKEELIRSDIRGALSRLDQNDDSWGDQ